MEMKTLTAKEKAELAEFATMLDAEIDIDDMPEDPVSNWPQTT